MYPLVDMGYSRESVHIHVLAWSFLSTALNSKVDKSKLHRCASPREAWEALLPWYGPQTTGAKSSLSRRLNIFKIAPGSNPLEEIGRIEDLATEMRTAGITLDDHMLYTIFIDALPAQYEVEARNLASRDSIGREDIIKAVRERYHRLSGSRKKGSNASHAGHAMFAGGGGGGRRKGPAAVPMGKVEAAIREKIDVGDSKDAAVKAPTRTVVARPRLSAAMAEVPKPPKMAPAR